VPGFVPSGFGDWVLPESEIKAKLKYDLNQAKQLAQSSGLAGTKSAISSYLRITGYYTDAPQYLQGQFKEIGVDVDVNWFPDTTAFTRSQTGGDFDMLLAPEAYNGDIDNWVYSVWNSKSPTNFAKLNDPKVDQFGEMQRAE